MQTERMQLQVPHMHESAPYGVSPPSAYAYAYAYSDPPVSFPAWAKESDFCTFSLLFIDFSTKTIKNVKIMKIITPELGHGTPLDR